MLNKEDIIRHMNAHSVIFGIPLSWLRVTAGAALVLHGLRKETQDVDIEVSSDTFRQLQANFPNASIRTGLVGYEFSIGTVVSVGIGSSTDNLVEIEGIQVRSLEDLLELYIMLYEHPQRPEEKSAKDGEARDALIKALDRKAAEAPLSLPDAQHFFGEFSRELDMLDRLKRFALNALHHGATFEFRGPNDELWYATLWNYAFIDDNSERKQLEIFETSLKASNYFASSDKLEKLQKADKKLRLTIDL